MMVQGADNQAPVKVSVIGVTDTPEVVAVTQGSLPNVVLQVIGPFTAVLVRFIHEFLGTFVGTLTAGTTIDGLIAGGRADFDMVVKAAFLVAVITAGIGALKNLVTIFGNLEQKFPLISGGV